MFGDDGDPFTDQTILYVVQKHRTKYDFLVITQDSGLAESLVHIQKSAAVQSRHDLAIVQVNHGGIEPWHAPRGTVAASCPVTVRRSPSLTKPQASPKLRPFALKPAPVTGMPQPVPVSEIPKEGDTVNAKSGQSHVLGRRIAGGGEGTIYDLGGPFVAKIYHSGSLSDRTLAKLELMVSRPVEIADLCWPKELLFNRHQEPVGYLMRKAEGKPLKLSIFVKPLLMKAFPQWQRTELVDVAIAVARGVQSLHAINVILGDINPLNILVTEARMVTFVDLDSAQIEDLPCPVGMVDYTRAEHHGKEFSSYLRSFEDDKFALAALIFMILMPGKAPFSHAGGGDPGENIRTRNFPYRIYDATEQGKSVVPDGAWRFIWSHFSRSVKEAFCRCFKDDQLLSPQEWIDTLTRYRSSIANGFMDQEMGNEIFPTRFRQLSDEERAKFGIEKRANMVALVCQHCGKTYELRESRVAELERQNRPSHACPDCAKAFGLLKQERLARGGTASSRPRFSRPPPSGAGSSPSKPKRSITKWVVAVLVLLVIAVRCSH